MVSWLLLIMLCICLIGGGIPMAKAGEDAVDVVASDEGEELKETGQQEDFENSNNNDNNNNNSDNNNEDDAPVISAGYVFLMIIWLSVLYAVFVLSRMKSKK